MTAVAGVAQRQPAAPQPAGARNAPQAAPRKARSASRRAAGGEWIEV